MLDLKFHTKAEVAALEKARTELGMLRLANSNYATIFLPPVIDHIGKIQ